MLRYTHTACLILISFFDIFFLIYYFRASLLFPLTKEHGCVMTGDEGCKDIQQCLSNSWRNVYNGPCHQETLQRKYESEFIYTTNSDFMEEVYTPFQERKLKHSNTSYLYCIRKRRAFTQVDNLWSKHTRNETREVNKWVCETDNRHSVV